MSNNIRIIYLYIVAFITLGMIVGGIFSTVYNITSFFCPTSSVFFEEYNNTTNDYDKYNTTSNQTKEIDDNNAKKNNYKKEKIKDSVVSAVIIIVGIILYKYHWKIIEKERNKGEWKWVCWLY